MSRGGNLRDYQWRSLEIERKRLKDVEPSLDNRDGVLSLLITLHDASGGKALGAATNHLNQQQRRLRINKVRHYTLKELRADLEKVVKDRKALQRLRQLLP